jgi:3-polyprenyl-4-hydroxybenzoate decarboxylase
VVARILDQLEVEHAVSRRWTEKPGSESNLL